MAAEQIEAGISFSPVFVPDDLIIKPLSEAPKKPEPIPYIPDVPADKKRLIVNIETTGLKSMNGRIISIAFQDPLVPNEQPTVIFNEDEESMLRQFFTIYKEGGFNEIIGYGFSFDLQWLLMKSMYYNIDGEEFFKSDIMDMMQAMTQAKLAFVYFPQKSPSLSDVCDYLFNFPKEMTDLEMIKKYLEGDYPPVITFSSNQITRILLVYLLYSKVFNTPIMSFSPGSGNTFFSVSSITPNETSGGSF